jgi:hypothetical protein
MEISNQNLKNFFQRDIIDLDEDAVEAFLSRYPVKAVIQCLFDQLKSFEYGDDAWRLAGAFADISKKYSVDIHIYSWLKTSTLNEKKILLNFLVGYYFNADPDIDIIIKISEELVAIINNSTELTWDEETILLAIEAILYAYFRTKQFFKENPDLEDRLRQQFIIFKQYISNADPQSSGYKILSGLEIPELDIF